jgi:hypothetical protein
MTRFVFLTFLLLPWIARAHIGSPNVFYEGQAGPYRVRVVVRPPEVVPGLAEISVRVEGEGVRKVTALPVFWKSGRNGAPPPDEIAPVRGEANLYAANLWLMASGTYSVEIEVEGTLGSGSVGVPVNSLALTRRPMKPWFATILSVLGLGLFVGAIRIAGAAFGEATLAPGVAIARADRTRSRIAMVIGALIFAGLVTVGKAWWDKEDADYRNNRLYKPQPMTAAVRPEGAQNILRLEVEPSDNRRGWSPLIPDHGKMMHLFLIREPSLDAFAHIHPVQRASKPPLPGHSSRLPIFEVAVPPLPAGTYRVYADVTHESGLSQTLVASTQVPDPVTPSGESSSATSADIFLAPDPDDSWHLDTPGAVAGAATSTPQSMSCTLAGGGTMVWDKDAPLQENSAAPLRFKLLDKDGKPAALQPYMGMLGHAAIRREDGAVFAHLHPVGTISMASQDFFARTVPDGNKLPPADAHEDHSKHMAGMKTKDAVSFPYEFPKAGRYRIWVQVKSGDQVQTGVFDTEVLAAGK